MMIRQTIALILLLVLASFARAQSPGPGPLTAKEVAQGYRDGYILAKPRAQHLASADAAESREGFKMARKFNRFGGLRLIKVPAGETPQSTIARLLATGRYEFVEPDYTRHITATPNDPSFLQQWALNNTGSNGPGEGIAGADIHAVSAWSTLTNTGPSVIVAILDTGIDLTHADLVANLWQNPQVGTDGYGADEVGINLSHNGNAIGDPSDDNGHGTHVAGIVGAVGNNGTGVAGVAWHTQLMALKFLGSDGNSNGSSGVSDEVTCIDYAIQKGVSVINASFGSSTYSSSEYTAIQTAGNHNIIFVAAAGNSVEDNDLSLFYPAGYVLDNIVAVGASDNRDDAASFTNYGSGLVELAAPGYQILSLYNSGANATATLSGTSMAAPFVTGSLALLKTEFPSDTYRQLINRLLNSVDQNANWTGRTQTGGRLNLANAVTATNNTPFNDLFARRAHLSGTTLTVRANNAGASREAGAGEPLIAGDAGGASLWWDWTAPATGQVTLDTSGSAYGTLVAAYTGTALNALATVAANSTAGTGASAVTFTAQAGTTYEITVDGQSGASGLTELNLAYANDAFATPITLTGASLNLTGTTLGATREGGEPLISGRAGGHSLWYSWRAPKSGQFQVSAFSFDFDPLLAVYTGTTLGGLTGVASNVGGTLNGNAAVPASTCTCTFTAAAGTTYAITIDGSRDSGTTLDAGQFTLSLGDSSWYVSTRDSVTCAPTVGADGTVYVGGDDGYLYATNASGSAKWKANLGGAMDSSAAALSNDGTAIYTGAGSYVFARSTADGSAIWQYSLTAAGPTTVASDGTIYVKDSVNTLYALNPAAASTRVKWTATVPGVSYSAPVIAANGAVYIGSDDATLYAINPATGAANWTFAADGAIFSSPAIDGAGNIYFGTINGTLYAVSPAGVQIWATKAGNGITSSPAIGANGIIYFGGYDRNLYALNPGNGSVAWTYPLGGEVRDSSPAIDANGVVYVGCYDNNVYAINANGSLNRIFASGYLIRSSPVVSGGSLYFGSEDHKLYAFPIAANAATSPWPMFLHSQARTGRSPGTVALSLTSAAIAAGHSFSLSAAASGVTAPTYQWYLNGVAIAGATDPILLVSGATLANAGVYTCTATGSSGSVTSGAATVTVGTTSSPGYLINLSARANVGAGNDILIGGFATGGAGTKQLLIRGAGPALSNFFGTAVLPTPQLTLLDGGAVVASNLGWANPPIPGPSAANDSPLTAATATLMNNTGAYPYQVGSTDAAMVVTAPTGNGTAQVSGVGGATGIALVEFYDADAGTPTSRLVNISARAEVGTGNNILIGGFAVGGATAETVLIRAVGPGLNDLLPGSFPLSSVLNQPVLTVLQGGTVIASNTVWGGDATLAAVFPTVGAFSLNAAHQDSVLLLTLLPGNYTAQVSGLNSGTGIALCEIYEVP